jgi:hypothetical protein
MTTKQRFPASRFIARYLVPALILITAAALLAVTGWRALERLPAVRVSPVAIIASQRSSTRVDGGLQAPGWIEPAPYAIEIRALREGVGWMICLNSGKRVRKSEDGKSVRRIVNLSQIPSSGLSVFTDFRT